MGANLAFENVGFRHGTDTEALSNIALDLPRGRCALIEGGAGAGKTTLAALAALDLLPSRGHVRLFGIDTATLVGQPRIALRRRIALVGESMPLLAGLTVRENVALPLAIHGVEKREAHLRVRELLGFLGLAERASTPAEALSRAERERTALARAVIARPELLIVDDPLSSADPQEVARVLPLLVRLLELGSAVLILGRSLDWARDLPAPLRWRFDQGELTAAAAP